MQLREVVEKKKQALFQNIPISTVIIENLKVTLQKQIDNEKTENKLFEEYDFDF